MYNFDIFQTLTIACLVLLLGYFLVDRIKLLSLYNIPAPVVGGFIFSLILAGLYHFKGLSFDFSTELKDTMMLFFFTCIGLSANFAKLLKGGKTLVVFAVMAFGLIFLQDTFGVILAKLFGISPAYGLIAGSITMTGGHGTGAAWAGSLTSLFNIESTMEIAMACATFGLVFGGIIGGPVAKFLLNRIDKSQIIEDIERDDVEEMFEKPVLKRRINPRSIVETLSLVSICLLIGKYVDYLTTGTLLQLPTFVWCLFAGTVIANSLSFFFGYHPCPQTVDVVGNVGLSLFLAIALMSLKLWELSGLAFPVFGILAFQVVLMVFYSIFVTFRFMGKDYDAVVLSAGHCGFGLGATPTAVANMQAVTSHFGPSHKAFLIVPMVGAFFIDLMNSFILKVFTEALLFFGI